MNQQGATVTGQLKYVIVSQLQAEFVGTTLRVGETLADY